MRAFAAISYRFLCGAGAFDRIRQPEPCIRWLRSHFERLAAGKAFRMKLRVGFEMLYDFPQPTPMIMVLGTHFTRASDVIVPDFLTTDPVGADHALSRHVRQLVQPHRRARRPRCVLPPTASCATAACPIRCLPPRFSTRSRICPRIPWSICSAAAIARPTGCPTSPGNCSRRRRRAGRGSRRSAISSIATSRSATSTRAPPRRRGRPTTKARASAATTRISPSRSAAA